MATIIAFDELRKTALGTEVKIEEYVENSNGDEDRESEVNTEDFKTNLFSCNTCKANFSERELYTAHLLTHSIEKRFQCKDCGKSFSTCNNLQKHCQGVHRKNLSIKINDPVVNNHNKILQHSYLILYIF